MLFRFLRQIHRSVVDPSFAAEIRSLPARSTAGFVFVLILLAAAAQSISHAVLLTDVTQGLPAVLPRLLPGMELRSGRLVSEREMPWVANPLDAADFMSLVTGSTPRFEVFPDSFLVVDTREGATIGPGSSVRMLLTAEEALLNLGSRIVVSVPYVSVVPAERSIVLHRETVTEHLQDGVLSLVLNLFLIHFLTSASGLLSTLVFLSFAAYIFTMRNRRLPYRSCLRLASFAVVPVVLLKVAGAVAGVRSEWLWNVSMVGSMVVLVRAVHWLNRHGDGEPVESNQ